MPSERPLRFPGIKGPDDEYDAAFDRADRWTGRVARGMAVGIPAWLILLLAIPDAFGWGPLPSLILATIMAIVFTEAVERLILRPLLAKRRRRPGYDAGIGRAGRSFAIVMVAWLLLVWPFAVNDVGNAWVAWLVPLALAILVAEGVELLVVRPLQRRRRDRA
jgi:hypothetical protein